MTEVYGFRHRHALAGTAGTDAPEHTPQPAPQVEQPRRKRLGLPRDLARFTGLFAISTDAAVRRERGSRGLTRRRCPMRTCGWCGRTAREETPVS